ncbi:unnamed protein product [Toxocara canis]|nr:unnamed protein product [Toxocara canis]
MVIVKTLVAAIITLANVECFLEIDTLCKMVDSRNDRWTLNRLNREWSRPRTEIQAEVAQIVSKQPEEVQAIYKKLVLSEMAKKEAEFEVDMIVLRDRGASQKLLDLKEKIHNITLDMQLSRRQVYKEIKQLKQSVSWKDRLMLHNSDYSCEK